METQTKVDIDEVKENVAEKSSEAEERSRVLVNEPPLDSVVKPFVEALTRNAESQVQNVIDQSFSQITQVEKGLENLASSIKGTSDKNAGTVKSICAEEEKADLHEKSRSTHVQPYVAVGAATRASWMNCCGLLDVRRPSDQ